MENIGLLSNAPEYDFVGVNMYVDDQGSIKRLPINLRASDIANVAGKPMEARRLPRFVFALLWSAHTCTHRSLGKLHCLPARLRTTSQISLHDWLTCKFSSFLGKDVMPMALSRNKKVLGLQVRGDAFLARVLDDGEAFDRLDLTVSEVRIQTDGQQ